VINFDYSLLYQSPTPFQPRAGKAAPSPPWSVGNVAKPQSELLRIALASRQLIDVEGQRRKLGASSGDFPELFALYNGFTSMDALAKRADAKGLGAIELKQLERRFAAGMKEIGSVVDGLDLEKLKLIRGEAAEKARTGAGVPRDTPEYRTGVVHRGDRDAGRRGLDRARSSSPSPSRPRPWSSPPRTSSAGLRRRPSSPARRRKRSASTWPRWAARRARWAPSSTI
jgi:hypothetical protein